MAFRFRRSIRLGPLRLNLSKAGLSSISIGRPGATINVPVARSGPARATASLVGTGLSWSEPLGQRPNTGQRRQQQRGSTGQPTTQQLVDITLEAFGSGPDSIGDCLWHQHGIGLIELLRQRDDTPRAVLEATSLLESIDRVELHVRRGRGPADSLQRTRQVLEAAQRVIAYGRDVGIVVD